MKKNILISGASGFIGQALMSYLASEGHKCYRLVRRDVRHEKEISWDPAKGEGEIPDDLDIHGLINLSGYNIAEKAWTDEVKEKILSSRLDATSTLVKMFADREQKPEVLVSASAVGYYGSKADKICTEESPPQDIFISKVCQEWEAAAKKAEDLGIRVVLPRIGMVIGMEGGALKKMIVPFKLGLGGVLGDGSQTVSWISLHDVCRIFCFALQEKSLSGPVNAVSPEWLSNREFTQTLGKVLHRPTLFPVPRFALKLLFGAEMADQVLLSDLPVKPEVLEKAGFEWDDASLEKTFKKNLA